VNAAGRANPGELRCASCGTEAAGVAPWRCSKCGSPLELQLPRPDDATFADGSAGGVWRYRGWLPDVDPVELGEPRTALVELADGGGGRVLAKLEGGLPTGSFKDRGSAVTVSWLRSRGVHELVVDSSGNAGASFAAYAARAGLALRVFVPADASPAKLLQVRAHGATLVPVPGSRTATGEAARAFVESAGPGVAYASHLWHASFLAGTATFAYEVYEQLGNRAPEAVIVPLGGGTLLLGIHLGFRRLREASLIDAVPRLIGVQSTACAPLARAHRAGATDAKAIDPEPTIAEGIKIALPPRSSQILAAVRETGGEILEVTDDEIRTSLGLLLAQGIFVEPTSASAHAGMRRLGGGHATMVLGLTAHGLKAAAAIDDTLQEDPGR
jgi:threonine synthase